MNLVGYTATALSRNDIEDTPTNKNVVVFAIVELKDLQGNLVVMYDDAEGLSPETQKICDTDGQCTFFAEVGDYVLEINGKAQRINLAANIADYIKLGTGESVQEFADSFALKIFQSPTDGGLTEIQTRTVSGSEVYEVRKTSDDSLATIYSDAAGRTEIVQNGTSNISDSAGVVEFYIADGDYYVEVGGAVSNFSTLVSVGEVVKIFTGVQSMIDYTGHAIGNKYSTGKTVWEVTTTVGVPLGGGLYATSTTPVDPIDFGADPTGVSDSTKAFTDTSLYTSTSIQWSFGTYKLKDYNILENQHIVSYGATITPLDNTATAVIAVAKSGWSLTGKTTFKGSRATLGDLVDTGECGLRIINGGDFKVENVNFVRFKGLAFDRQGVTGAVTQYFGNRGQYSNILMFENLQGGRDSAEYEVYTNLNVIANVKGFESVGGNISWVGGNCTNNTDGFLITTGPNNAHGIATGVHFNHNIDRNIYINRSGLGFTFDGCHSYANNATGSGKIEIVQSGGIDFHGGVYDCWFEVDETPIAGIGDNFIRDIFAPGSYGNLKIFNHLGNRAATMLTSGIRGAGAINGVDGLTVNDVAPIAFLVKRLGLLSQALTSSIETVLTFPEIRPMGDTRALLPAGTISSFPTPYKGYYSISIDAVLAGTTINSTASYIVVYVDGVAQGYFYGKDIGVVAGKNGLKFHVSVKAYAESIIQFKANAVGSDLVHAISVFNSNVEVLLIN